MRWTLGALLALAAGCGTRAPDWVDSCDCPEGKICRFGGGDPLCADPPEECGSAFDGTCSVEQADDDACKTALCPDIDSGGTYGFDAECWSDGDRTWKMVDCNAQPF